MEHMGMIEPFQSATLDRIPLTSLGSKGDAAMWDRKTIIQDVFISDTINHNEMR